MEQNTLVPWVSLQRKFAVRICHHVKRLNLQSMQEMREERTSTKLRTSASRSSSFGVTCFRFMRLSCYHEFCWPVMFAAQICREKQKDNRLSSVSVCFDRWQLRMGGFTVERFELEPLLPDKAMSLKCEKGLFRVFLSLYTFFAIAPTFLRCFLLVIAQ